jgi:hypothetical protein
MKMEFRHFLLAKMEYDKEEIRCMRNEGKEECINRKSGYEVEMYLRKYN